MTDIDSMHVAQIAGISSTPTVVGLGEALFDCFDDRDILGGAPINFVVHAHRLLSVVGGRGVVVSRVGSDGLGDELCETLRVRGLDVSCIQRDERRPTGTVRVTLDAGGHAEYDIVEGVAWDFLAPNAALDELAGRCSAVCFGTLAQRSATSRETIQRFVAQAPQALQVFDVNMRQQYFSGEVVEQGLRLANFVKLNEDELPRVCGLLGIAGNDDVERQAWALYEAFDLRGLALTRGAKGTLLFRDGETYSGDVPAFSAEPGADSVGAGDGCCAGLVCGTLLGWPPRRIVDLANAVGAFVAGRRGATPELPESILPTL
ncbi:MAG: carbohydrate kinase [Pirellulales bacterium]|nr:carbohydrate kinase [Pirellulales bacterium]